MIINTPCSLHGATTFRSASNTFIAGLARSIVCNRTVWHNETRQVVYPLDVILSVVKTATVSLTYSWQVLVWPPSVISYRQGRICLLKLYFGGHFVCKWPIAVLVKIPQSAPSLSPHNAPTTAAISIVICILCKNELFQCCILPSLLCLFFDKTH